MSRRSKSELIARLGDASNRIAELESARLRADTLFAVTQVLGKTLSLQDTFETILGQLQRVVPYDSSSVQVIQGNRLVIVGGRGFDDPQALLGLGFDLDDETNPSIQVLRSKRQHVLQRRVSSSAFRQPATRWRSHSRLDLRAADLQRSHHRRPHSRQVRARFLQRGSRRAGDGIRRPGRDGDRERTLARNRARRPRSEPRRCVRRRSRSAARLSLPQVFDLILSELRKAVPYDSCSVQEIDGNEMVIVGGHGFPEP